MSAVNTFIHANRVSLDRIGDAIGPATGTKEDQGGGPIRCENVAGDRGLRGKDGVALSPLPSWESAGYCLEARASLTLVAARDHSL